jgi:hypothetical protein
LELPVTSTSTEQPPFFVLDLQHSLHEDVTAASLGTFTSMFIDEGDGKSVMLQTSLASPNNSEEKLTRALSSLNEDHFGHHDGRLLLSLSQSPPSSSSSSSSSTLSPSRQLSTRVRASAALPSSDSLDAASLSSLSSSSSSPLSSSSSTRQRNKKHKLSPSASQSLSSSSTSQHDTSSTNSKRQRVAGEDGEAGVPYKRIVSHRNRKYEIEWMDGSIGMVNSNALPKWSIEEYKSLCEAKGTKHI